MFFYFVHHWMCIQCTSFNYCCSLRFWFEFYPFESSSYVQCTCIRWLLVTLFIILTFVHFFFMLFFAFHLGFSYTGQCPNAHIQIPAHVFLFDLVNASHKQKTKTKRRRESKTNKLFRILVGVCSIYTSTLPLPDHIILLISLIIHDFVSRFGIDQISLFIFADDLSFSPFNPHPKPPIAFKVAVTVTIRYITMETDSHIHPNAIWWNYERTRHFSDNEFSYSVLCFPFFIFCHLIFCFGLKPWTIEYSSKAKSEHKWTGKILFSNFWEFIE